MAIVQIGAQVAGVNIGQLGNPFWPEKIKKGGEVGLVGQDGVGGQAAFQGEVLQELIEKRLGKKRRSAGWRGRRRRLEPVPVGAWMTVGRFSSFAVHLFNPPTREVRQVSRARCAS